MQVDLKVKRWKKGQGEPTNPCLAYLVYQDGDWWYVHEVRDELGEPEPDYYIELPALPGVNAIGGLEILAEDTPTWVESAAGADALFAAGRQADPHSEI